MLRLSQSLLTIIASAFEVAVFERLEAVDKTSRQSEIPTLAGVSGTRRCRRSTLTQAQWLDKLVNSSGSKEVVMATLTARSSSASVVRNVTNTLYMEDDRKLLSAATSLSFSWDGATYSGLSVNVGMVVDCHTGFGAHIRPLVTSV